MHYIRVCTAVEQTQGVPPVAPSAGYSSAELRCYHEDKWCVMGWMYRCLLLVIRQCHSVACGGVNAFFFCSHADFMVLYLLQLSLVR